MKLIGKKRKVVKTLDNPTHLNDIWLDEDGFVWFFDSRELEWRVLGDMGPGLGYANERTYETDGWPDGPFTRLLKGSR